MTVSPLRRRHVDAGALHQPCIAEKHYAAVDLSLDALTGNRFEVRDLGGLQAFCFGAMENRFGKRMLAANLKCSG